jgi:hypothetical protein
MHGAMRFDSSSAALCRRLRSIDLMSDVAGFKFQSLHSRSMWLKLAPEQSTSPRSRTGSG